LEECTGDDLWSIEHCRLRRIPEPWIAELADAFESGFDNDSHTIYVENRPTNQYAGVRDVDLAIRIAKTLGMNVESLMDQSFSRRAVVEAIKRAVMEGDV
jgi:hypothetical protein